MLKIVNIIFLVTLVNIQYSFGAFNMINSSARALGMGNAFVSVADDINCLLDNPAGLSNLKSWETTFTASKIAWGVENMGENFFAFGLPLKGTGAVGVGYYSYAHPLYGENVIFLAYATPVSLLAKSSVSINAKYLSKSYTSNEWTALTLNPDFTALSKSSISFGVSVHSFISNDLALGLFIDDLNSPDVGAFSVEILPVTARLGFKYNLDKTTLVNGEGYSRGRDLRFFFGGESSAYKTDNIGTFLIRAGFGVGNNGYLNATAGIGYKFNVPYLGVGGQFDYGFQFPFGFVSGSAGNHMIALTLRAKYVDALTVGTEKEDKNLPTPK